MFSLLEQPGTRWISLGFLLMSFPLLWRVRLRSRNTYDLSLKGTLVAVYLVSTALLIGAVTTAVGADTRSLMEAQLMIGLAAVGYVMANPIARIAIGPEQMKLEPRRLRRYWTWSTLAGLMFIGIGVIMFDIAKRAL